MLNTEINSSENSYMLGHSDKELARLSEQARIVGPITKRVFLEAGLVPGMRVLDIGSGAGDVSFLVADLVGDNGTVVGVDRSSLAVVAATTRAIANGRHNVSFHEGDPAEMTFDEPFDAITGRYVLVFQKNYSEMLKNLSKHVRPGGLIVFHEGILRALSHFRHHQSMTLAVDGLWKRRAPMVWMLRQAQSCTRLLSLQDYRLLP
jgi:ubiquinone/menaquinone biosynthesis C-methylase UbiE